MRNCMAVLFAYGLLLGASVVAAQPPREDDAGRRGWDGDSKTLAIEDLVAVMMAFDKNKDGRLTKDEVTDPRLHRLFDRADANKDGSVSKEELNALFSRESVHANRRSGFGPGGGFFGGPPRPGQIMPPFIQDELQLTDSQKKQLNDLQKEVDSKVNGILTEAQRKQLAQMLQRRMHFGRPMRPRSDRRNP